MGAGQRIRAVAIACGLTVLAVAGTAQANNIPVGTTEDEFNNMPSNTGCALREAIEAAQTNAIHGGCAAGGAGDVIQLAAGATYELEIDGTIENLNQTGDLDVRDAMTIRTPTGAPATINAAGVDRAIEIFNDPDPGDVFTLNLERLRIVNGLSDDEGGAVFTGDNELRTDGVVFEDNSAIDSGGAIRTSGETWIRDSSFIDNDSADGEGGAIAQDDDTPGFDDVRWIERSAFVDNTADGLGGAIHFFGGAGDDAVLSNSTFTANEGSDGGAIHYVEGGDSPPSLRALTVAGNRATANAGAGGITIQAFNLSNPMFGSVIAGNTNPLGPSNCNVGAFAPFSGGVYNIESGDDCNLSPSTNLVNTDPQLSPAAQYPAADASDPPTIVIPPFTGGPAADAISQPACPLVQPPDDQRGVARSGGPCTIGAFEGSVPGPQAPAPVTLAPAPIPAAPVKKKCKKKKSKKASGAKMKKRCKKRR